MNAFESLGLSPELLKAVTALGYETPTPVQEQVIPALLTEPRDIVVLSQTGTGKTAAFGLPLLQGIDTSEKAVQALILSPTRELCNQIAHDLADYARFMPGVRIVAVYGGASIENQLKELKRGAHIIVATPGRMVDMLNRKAVSLLNVHSVVLDEADEMLNMGFSDSLKAILSNIPQKHYTLLFSATMPPEIAAISRKYMSEPLEITIGTKNTGSENVKHECYLVHAKDKYQALKRIADYHPDIYGIVFCRTRRETQEIADKLIRDGYNADSLHGDLSQVQRDLVMQKFRVRNIQLLVATDVAARGLDVDDLTHVIHYSLPEDPEVYNHRSGRTGRAGKKGISVAIIHMREKGMLRQIGKKINRPIDVVHVPTGREICEKQLFHLIDRMENVEVDYKEIDRFLPAIFKKLEWMPKEDLIRKFVALEFNSFLDYYRGLKDLDIPSEDQHYKDRDDRPSKGKSRGRREEEDGYTRLFINIGKMDGISPQGLIEFINRNTKGKMVPIGKIDLMRNFSFFEVDPDYVPKLVDTLSQAQHNGRKVAVELADAKGGSGKKSSGGGGHHGGGGFKKNFRKPSYGKSGKR